MVAMELQETLPEEEAEVLLVSSKEILTTVELQLSSLVQAVVEDTDKAVPVEVKLEITEALVVTAALRLLAVQEPKALTVAT